MRRASSSAATAQQLRLPDAGQAARHRGGRASRRSAARRSAGDERRRSRRAPARSRRSTTNRDLHATARSATRPSTTATTCARATRIAGPAVIARGQRDDRRRARLARDADAARPPRARARRGRASARTRSAPTADPVLLEVFNNLFMAIAEQMGVHAREHRVLGQHQGAARLLLRAVRRRRQPDRQRAAHAGAPGLDGRERAGRSSTGAAAR